MCGLAGILTQDARAGEDLDGVVRRMIAGLEHRGPDDDGTWVERERGIALGFRRLAIVDLSEHGHQPMRSASGRFTMVFNGEVYNHRELRRELERPGCRFRGRSDSEVILAAFERWGIVASLRRFIGMFAIAVWDGQDRSLTLVRDRLGIKPLFVYARPGLVTFGSELKAIFGGPAIDRSLDPDALAAYLRYLYIPAPKTVFRHVSKLLPGHYLTIRDAGRPLPPPEPYWSAESVAREGVAEPFRGSDLDAVDALEQGLEEAVRTRMLADVPVGALLSGGIDSSTVVALMQAASSRPVRTFSIGFDEERHNEAPHAARVARHLGTDHTELRVTGADTLALVPRLPELFDEPLADPSQIPTFLVSQLARQEVTVALSGDGGDELFAGYNRYAYGERLMRRLTGVSRPARRLVAAGIGAVSTGTWDRLHRSVEPILPIGLRHRLPGEKLHKVRNLLRCDSAPEMYRSLLSANQEPESLLSAGRTRPGPLERIFEDDALSPLDRMMLTDQVTYLPDDLLAKVDRASMAVSLEVRVPILDHRVVELSWRLPRSMKFRDGQSKWLLRRVLERKVPAPLIDRPKMGFSVPIETWLRGPLRAWAAELLAPDRLASTGALRPDAVREEWRAFETGRGTAIGIWALLMFQAWAERWVA